MLRYPHRAAHAFVWAVRHYIASEKGILNLRMAARRTRSLDSRLFRDDPVSKVHLEQEAIAARTTMVLGDIVGAAALILGLPMVLISDLEGGRFLIRYSAVVRPRHASSGGTLQDARSAWCEHLSAGKRGAET